MRSTNILILALLFMSVILLAQEPQRRNGIGIGYQINQYQRDFGLGFNLTSPYFAHKQIAVRLRGNLLFNEHEKNGNETVWTPYSAVSLGVIGQGVPISDRVSIYGEGGALCLFPSGEFSEKNTVFGGYGLFGFEFYMSSFSNYFIEIGGLGSGAVADKIPKKPIYANGLLINAGFRFIL